MHAFALHCPVPLATAIGFRNRKHKFASMSWSWLGGWRLSTEPEATGGLQWKPQRTSDSLLQV